MKAETITAIVEEISSHYEVVRELDVEVDENTKTFKATHVDSLDGYSTVQTYVYRGNIDGKVFHLRDVLAAGRVNT